MARLVNRPINVLCEDSTPTTMMDRDTTYHIAEIVDDWKEAGQWWAGEPSRHVYRVMTTELAVFDIEQVGQEWWLYRVWD